MTRAARGSGKARRGAQAGDWATWQVTWWAGASNGLGLALAQVLDACQRAGASAVYCTPLSPSWLLVHVDLGAQGREAFARALRPYHRGVRVTVGEA